MKTVKLRGLQLLSSNEGGSTFQMPGQSSKKVLLLHKTKGSISGNYLHDARFNGIHPTDLLLISGTIKLDARDLNTQEVISVTIDAPTQIKISSHVEYTFTALTECCFLEFSLKLSVL